MGKFVAKLSYPLLITMPVSNVIHLVGIRNNSDKQAGRYMYAR